MNQCFYVLLLLIISRVSFAISYECTALGSSTLIQIELDESNAIARYGQSEAECIASAIEIVPNEQNFTYELRLKDIMKLDLKIHFNQFRDASSSFKSSLLLRCTQGDPSITTVFREMQKHYGKAPLTYVLSNNDFNEILGQWDFVYIIGNTPEKSLWLEASQRVHRMKCKKVAAKL